MARSEIKRGEIWLTDLGMAQKVRPALVISVPYLDHERALVTYVPRTTSLRGTRFEVSHRAKGFEEGAFDIQAVGTMPVTKFLRRIAAIETETMLEVEAALRLWLSITGA